MTKQRKIQAKLELLNQRLVAAERYVARNVNVRGTAAWLHLSDWKGGSGHPLWMKNHMIPSTEQARMRKTRALERIDRKDKEKKLKQRRQLNSN